MSDKFKAIVVNQQGENFSTNLVFNEEKKVFDPEKVYKGLVNPTKL